MTCSESRHVIAHVVDPIALGDFVQSTQVVSLKLQYPAFLCAASPRVSKAGENGTYAPDLELKVLAFVEEIPIGASGNLFG